MAAAAFVDPSLHNEAWRLTGCEAVTLEDVASILTDALDRPIRYRPAGALAYLMHVWRSGAPFGQTVVQTILHTGLRRGAAERVDPRPSVASSTAHRERYATMSRPT